MPSVAFPMFRQVAALHALYSNTALGSTKAVPTAAPVSLKGWHIFNPNGSVTYIQFFDALTGDVTVGTTAPTFAIGIAANAPVTLNLDSGIRFATGIVVAAITTPTGSTGPGTAVVMTLIYEP